MMWGLGSLELSRSGGRLLSSRGAEVGNVPTTMALADVVPVLNRA